jgi:hypothetical protein
MTGLTGLAPSLGWLLSSLSSCFNLCFAWRYSFEPCDLHMNPFLYVMKSYGMSIAAIFYIFGAQS